MLKQVIVSLLVFEGYFFSVTGFSEGVTQDAVLWIFNGVFAAWLAMEAARVRLGHSGKSQTFGLMSRFFLFISFFTVALGIYDRASGYTLISGALPSLSFVIGSVLLALGIYLRHTSIKTLGRFFVTKVQVTDDHELVRDGIYGYLRHPSYTGLIVGFLGAVLMLGSSVALITFVVIGIPAYIYRIWVEEKALIGSFGDKYTDYKLNTYAIFPYLY